MNILYDRDAQKEVEKYIYCKEFRISPCSFGEQPKKLVDKMFLIKKALAKREQSMVDKQNREIKNG